MAQVAISKVTNDKNRTLPIFAEVARRLDAVRQRAFELFERRGRDLGHELEDWFRAEREVFGWPAAEMTRKDGGYELQITLPGFDAKDVEVTASPAEVIVHASAKHEKKTTEGDVLWTEYGSNDVYRRFALPAAIDVDKVTANLDKGILRIAAPAANAQKAMAAVA